MAKRRERCQRCGLTLFVPYEAQRIRCPNCQTMLQFLLNHNGHYSPEVTGNLNGVPNNMGMGYWRPGGNRPLQIPPPVQPPPVYGQKRALICGISYKNHQKSLKGSINDARCMRYLLVQRLGFPSASVLVLTEEERDPSRIPTKHNIRAAFNWLVQGCRAGDSLLFYYTGHGSQIRDVDGDEIDGQDEALCPVDFETEGKILDDEINATIVRPLTPGVTLHAIIDTCFSGTSLDLDYVYRVNRDGGGTWEDQRIPHAGYRGTEGGLAISISACEDHQNSQDTTYFTGTSTGALTYSFIKVLEYEPRLTYGRLLMEIGKSIYQAHNGQGLNGTLPPHLLQDPQLSSSAPFDIHRKPFIL